ncbi:RES domain-containing protein [Leifsonia flava]|uniref:RES domain-containing protein n=1 Tax=Orlajensenia leifsoniae TaxID=2561933 RepID=UPI003B82F0BE
MGTSGHPDYLHRPQGGGRADNANEYDTWYYALTPEAAVGEVFGEFAEWSDEMFDVPYLPSGRRALAAYEIPDLLRFIDLDDARNLVDRGLRPTQVVSKNLGVTQGWAMDVFRERNSNGAPRWDGLRWWSFWRPNWTVFARWRPVGGSPDHQLLNIEYIDITHHVVDVARKELRRPRR